MKHALNLFTVRLIKIYRSAARTIATLYASRVCDRGGKKSRSVSLSMFLFIFFCFSFSSSIPLPLLIHPHSRIGGGSTCRECPANRAIIRETHLGARQTRLNLFLVDPMPTRQPLLASLFLFDVNGLCLIYEPYGYKSSAYIRARVSSALIAR